MQAQAIEAPSFEYICALQSELEAQYSEQDDQIRRMRAVRELKQPSGLDDQFRLVNVEVRDPTATDECQRVSAMLAVNPPVLTVTPSRRGDEADKNATFREHWTEEVLRVAGTRIPGQSTFGAMVDACVSDGGAWCKLVFSPDLWENRYSILMDDFDDDVEEVEEEGKKVKRVTKTRTKKYDEATEDAKKSTGPPFTWIAVDALSVYPVWQGNKLGEVLEVQERPASSTFRRYRLKRTDKGEIVPEETGQPAASGSSKGGSTVQFLEHWDSRWVTYIVKDANNGGSATGRIVKQWEHGYGRVPYFYAPGLMMNHWRNRKVGWSIAEAKRWMVEYRSYLWTLHAQLAARDTLTPMFRERNDTAASIIGQDGSPKANERWNLGEIIEGQPGEKLMPIQFPPAAASLREQIAIVSDSIERLESPRVSGQIGGLEGAGFAMSQVLAEMRTRHDPLAQSIERMMVDLTRFLWHLVRTKVQETVWVYREGRGSGWLGADPDDLTDTVGIKWRLDPERPSGKLIEARYWHERMTAGTAASDQAIDALGDNPDEVRIGRALDRIRQSDWYTKQLDAHVAQEAGMGDLLEEARQVAETGVLPGTVPLGGPPAMGNELVPDMGNLAMSPNGAGASPMAAPGGAGAGPAMASVPRNMPVPGVGPGAVVPEQAAAAGIQRLQG